MFELDLVIIGDGACINFVYVIVYMNMLGVFVLNNIFICECLIFCMESCVMGGTKVGVDFIFFEYTFVMVGDDVERGGIW